MALSITITNLQLTPSIPKLKIVVIKVVYAKGKREQARISSYT